MTKILVATEKPFAKAAIEGIKKIISEAGFETILLENYSQAEDIIKAIADVDALIIRSDKATKEVIEAGKNLKLIVRAGAGYDNIDLAAASAKGIVAMNTPGQNSNAVAELTFGMLVFMAPHISGSTCPWRAELRMNPRLMRQRRHFFFHIQSFHRSFELC